MPGDGLPDRCNSGRLVLHFRLNQDMMPTNAMNSPCSPIPVALPRESYGQGWRWLTVIAGLALAATFFMPFTGSKSNLGRATGPNTIQPTHGEESFVDAPYVQWGQLVNRLTTTPVAWWWAYHLLVISLLPLTCFPQFWGLAMAIYSLAQLMGSRRTRDITSRIGLIGSTTLGVLLAVLLVVGLAKEVGASPSPLPAGAVFYLSVFGVMIVLFILLPVLHGILATRRRDWAYLYHGFTAAFLLVMPLDLIVVLGIIRRDLGLNVVTIFLVASCLLLLARIGEARAVSRLSWFRTILGLSLLRLHRYALPPGHCPACGYNLHALPEPRCPECGRPFTPAEASSQPTKAIEQLKHSQ